jgi:hypothetical protein
LKPADKSLSRSTIEASALSLEEIRQLGDVARDTPRLVHRKHMGDVRLSLRLSGLDVGERLPGGVDYLVAARDFLR